MIAGLALPFMVQRFRGSRLTEVQGSAQPPAKKRPVKSKKKL